jgi:collagen type VII alpha
MAIPSRQIGWGTEENLLWQISKQLEYLSGITYNSGGGSGSGTSGTAGVSGTVGTSGTAGVSGSSGTSGISGTAGASGTAGTSGVSGTSGTSPVFPFPTVFGLYAQTADSVDITNTTTETTIIGSGVGTLTVGANQFAVGDSFRADLAGVMGAQNNETLRIRIKAGSIVLVDSGFQNLGSAISADVWSLSVNFTVRAVGAAGVASVASLGTFNFTKTNNGTVEGFSFNTLNNTTFDTTISNTLGITVEWGAANIENTIYSDIFVLNKVY